MRLTFLALSAAALSAALTSIACGSAAPEAGNAYVTSGALEGVDGVGADSDVPFEVISIAEDTTDHGCSVDGIRYGTCTLTVTQTVDMTGRSLDLCELQVDTGNAFLWECGLGANSNVTVDELPWHCPGEH